MDIFYFFFFFFYFIKLRTPRELNTFTFLLLSTNLLLSSKCNNSVIWNRKYLLFCIIIQNKKKNFYQRVLNNRVNLKCVFFFKLTLARFSKSFVFNECSKIWPHVQKTNSISDIIQLVLNFLLNWIIFTLFWRLI